MIYVGFIVVLVLKPFVHGVVSVVIVSVYFFWVGESLSFLFVWLLFGFVVGVGVDVDHVFLALLFNWRVAVKDILSLNPLRLYNDFMGGNISGNKLVYNQFVIYSSFHLIIMITVNLLVQVFVGLGVHRSAYRMIR